MANLPCPATVTDVVCELESTTAIHTASALPDRPIASDPTQLEWFVGVGVVLAVKALPGATPNPLLPAGSRYTLLALPAQRPPAVHGCCVGRARVPPGSMTPSDGARPPAANAPPQFYDVVLVPTQASPARCFTLANVYRPPTGDILALVSHSEEVINLTMGPARPTPTASSNFERFLHQVRFETQRLNAGPVLSHRLPQRYPQFTAQLRWLWAHSADHAVTAHDVARFLCSTLALNTSAVLDPAFDHWLQTSVTACAGKLFLYLPPP
ncbi:hypothetical protein H4R34_000857 [Dimargaris verticillata]|uniref:Uncharacterized protein n=1 Tax=Dimargaris verticillata TaxID=2761393 RepID=A0A9W8B5G7_9FUNG|nr:hypothetical protein H4R34_000857 [Dimargaris verticillata]